MKLQEGPPFFFLLPPSLLSSDRRRSAARRSGKAGRPPPTRRGTHASRPRPSLPLFPRVGAVLLLPRAPDRPPAATLPPPWPGQDRASALDLSRARALQKPLRADPLVLSPFPHPQRSGTPPPSTRTPASSSPPSNRASTAAPPAPTPPPALPHPRVASRQPLVDPLPPEPLRRRASSATDRPPPPIRLLRSSPIAPRAPEGAARSLLHFPQPLPRRRLA